MDYKVCSRKFQTEVHVRLVKTTKPVEFLNKYAIEI